MAGRIWEEGRHCNVELNTNEYKTFKHQIRKKYETIV